MEGKGVGAGGARAAGRKGCILWSPHCPAWEQECPQNSPSGFTQPQKQKHILPQHTLGKKTIPKVNGDILLLADAPKIILKGTFNETNLFSLCFGFQGLIPGQKQLYGKLLEVKQSLATNCDLVLQNPLGIKIPFSSSYKPIMKH